MPMKIEEVRRLKFERWGNSDFPLAAQDAGIGPVSRLHCHDFYELVYIRHGGGVHVIDGHPYPMLRGDFYLMHPDDRHGYRDAERGSAIVNLLFQPELFHPDEWNELCAHPGLRPFFDRENGKPAHKLALTPNDAHRIERLCDDLVREYREKPSGWRLAMRAAFIDLLVRIGRANLAYGQQGYDEQLQPGPVADAIARLHRDWDQPIGVRELANRSALSANWFGELFKQQTGLTVQAYQTKLRIDHARRMLEQESLSVIEIALNCGYEDPSYFGRVFRKVTGVTPRAYRRLLDH